MAVLTLLAQHANAADSWFIWKGSVKISNTSYDTSDACIRAARKLKPPLKQYTCIAAVIVTEPPPVAVGPLPAASAGFSWQKIADENASFTYVGLGAYGTGTAWATRMLTGLSTCGNVFFGVDPLVGTAKTCQVQVAVPVPPPNPPEPMPTDHHAGVAVADASQWPTPQPGINYVNLSEPGAVPPAPAEGNWEADGAARLLCNWSRMSYDDPIVYPGQPGMAHHHTFFSNTAIDSSTTSDNIRTKGNASCRGGTINMSGYWVPSMIDTATGKPIAPKTLLIYYKTGFWPYMNDGSIMQPLPKNLKMIAGEATRTTPDGVGQFVCMIPATGSSRFPPTKAIPSNCLPGDEVWSNLPFPQCWDGVNLDSPNHKSHMAYPIQVPSTNPERQYACPATHPVVLPAITFNVEYTLPANPADTANWRLSSDTYSGPGGYSMHGDWMGGWDPAISDLWGIKCMRERRNCGSMNLGDGRQTLEFQGN